MEATIVKLEANKRDENKNPRQLRAEGFLPVTIYGKDVNLNAQVSMREFKLAYARNKQTQFDFVLDGKTYSTITKNVQINAATTEIQSAEFAIR